MLLNKHFRLLFLYFFTPFFLLAQQQGEIHVTVLSAETNAPISGASAALLNQSTMNHVKGAQSSDDGKLVFEGIPAGEYALRITYVGKVNAFEQNLQVKAAETLQLGKIFMADDGEFIQEVVVEAQAPEMRLGVDRKIFDVSQSTVSLGGTASDLLANVPTLEVDMDGAVSLRGSSSVRILIDGKESAMAGNDINSLLQSLPANAIDKVEIITNPSSKYDAEGQSGIINIVLKKNIRTGLNGIINASVGSYDNYMAGATLNYRDKKFNYFGSYNFGHRNRVGSGVRNNLYLGDQSQINNTEETSRLGVNNTVKLGVDYYMNEKTTIGVSGNLSIRDNDRRGDLFYTYIKHPQLSGTSTRLSRQNEDDLGYDLNVDFTRKFNREGSELTANFSYGKDTEDGVNSFDQTYSADMPANGRINQTSENGSVLNMQVDYVLPFSEESKFEAGYRSIIRKSFDTQFSELLDTDLGEYFPDYTISNDFDMTSGVHAFYANYQNKLFDKLGYQVGLRAEQADLNTIYYGKDPELPADEIETPGSLDYFRWYPSVFLTYDVGQSGDKVQLSYTRRVQRPRGWQVNPFPNVSDEMNRREGNPNLMPEDIHSMELGFAKFYQGWNFITSAYYRRMNDVMQPYIYDVDEQSVTYSRWENLTSSNVAGLELISKVNITNWWDVTWNGNFFYNKFEGNADFDITEQEGFNWNTNINTNVKFMRNLAMQVRAHYAAPRIMAQGKSKPMTGVDMALKQELWNKRASVALNVRDVFNTRRFAADTYTPQIHSNFEHRWMKRMFTLSFSYRFGIQDLNQRNEDNNEPPMEEMGGDF